MKSSTTKKPRWPRAGGGFKRTGLTDLLKLVICRAQTSPDALSDLFIGIFAVDSRQQVSFVAQFGYLVGQGSRY